MGNNRFPGTSAYFVNEALLGSSEIKLGNIKGVKMKRQLLVLKNIIIEEMFTWEFLLFLICSQRMVTCLIFCDMRICAIITHGSRVTRRVLLHCQYMS